MATNRAGKGLLPGPIAITNTTVLRTRAFKEKMESDGRWTRPPTVSSVRNLSGGDWEQTQFPPPKLPRDLGIKRGGLRHGSQVVTNYTLAQEGGLPPNSSMSIVTEMKNLFDATTGIYANASGHGGKRWEAADVG